MSYTGRDGQVVKPRAASAERGFESHSLPISFAGGGVDSDTQRGAANRIHPLQADAPQECNVGRPIQPGAIPARQLQKSIDRITRQLCDEYRENSRQMVGYNITRETMVRLMDEGIAEYERIEEPEREREVEDE